MSTESDLSEMKQDIKKILSHLSETVGKFDSHVGNASIHQLPPCKFHDRLTAKLWALAATAIAALGHSVYSNMVDRGQ